MTPTAGLETITSRQRKQLKALAHHLEPVVRVGKARVSEAVLSELRKTLEAHELIKVRIESDEGTERKTIAKSLASASESVLVSTVGKIAILYRRNELKPQIELTK